MKTRFRCALIVAALLTSGPAMAQGYPAPAKVIRFVIGFPAGSTIDNVSRVLIEDIHARTGANIVVDNRPGALGVIGVELVSKAKADGYTMMPSSSATNSSGPFLSKAAQRVDAVKGLTHVARVARFDILVVTKSGGGLQTAAALVSASKANASHVMYGYGSGTGQVAAAAFCRAANIAASGVPYKGQPPALTDLIGGQVSFVAADLGAVMPQVISKSLTAIAVLSDKRSTILSDVPTTKELGFGSMDLRGWIGLAGPSKLPPEVVQWWTTQLSASLARHQIRERLLAMGVEPDLLEGAPLQAFVARQYDTWGKQTRDAGIQPE